MAQALPGCSPGSGRWVEPWEGEVVSSRPEDTSQRPLPTNLGTFSLPSFLQAGPGYPGALLVPGDLGEGVPTVAPSPATWKSPSGPDLEHLTSNRWVD